MYSLSMIADMIPQDVLRHTDIIPGDSISSIRMHDSSHMKEHILYISTDGDSVLCKTASGSSLTCTGEITDVLNLLLDIIEVFTTWEKDLAATSRKGCTLEELLDISYPVLKHPLFILDNEQWLIAYSYSGDIKMIQQNEDLTNLLHFHSSQSDKVSRFNELYHDYYQLKDVYKIPGSIFTDSGYAFNLFRNNIFCGVIIIEFFNDTVTRGKLDMFQILGRHIQGMLDDPSSGLSIGPEEPYFLRFLETPSAENENLLHHILQVSGWKDSDPKQIICIAPSSAIGLAPGPNRIFVIFSRIFGLKAAFYHDNILLFINLRIMNEQQSYEPLLHRIAQLAYCAGISNNFYDISALPVIAERAQLALKMGDRNPGALNYFEKHYLQYFFSLMQKEDAAILRHPFPGELKQHDSRCGSRLYETLFSFLKNERSITRTAKELGLHRSTLIHRVERIEEMAEGILDDPDKRLQIMLTYYLDCPEAIH